MCVTKEVLCDILKVKLQPWAISPLWAWLLSTQVHMGRIRMRVVMQSLEQHCRESLLSSRLIWLNVSKKSPHCRKLKFHYALPCDHHGKYLMTNMLMMYCHGWSHLVCEILIDINNFSFKKCIGKCRLQNDICLGRNVLTSKVEVDNIWNNNDARRRHAMLDK